MHKLRKKNEFVQLIIFCRNYLLSPVLMFVDLLQIAIPRS